MKKFCFCELPVGTFFLFRGQRFKKLETSLAEDSKSARIVFDRGIEVQPIWNQETAHPPSIPPGLHPP
jgi:hypothetical protein